METVKDLIAQREALDRKIKDAQRSERHAAVVQIRELMATYDLTADDLSGRMPKAATTARRGARSAKAAAGGKVPAKYRNAKTGDTWSGRGLQPKWLRAELAAGRKLTDFAV